MSMICYLVRVPAGMLDLFRKKSALFESYLDSEEIDKNGHRLDLDKSWDALNYLLTGHTLDTIEDAEPPLSDILFSGQILDEDQDMGYGPAQYLEPGQVKVIHNALSEISVSDIRDKYDAGVMNEKNVYPASWKDNEEDKNYILDSFEDLKAFYEDAADEGQSVISFLS
ncbi:MAG TPA: YfbM family protein [Chitinophagaceae bacterium]